MILSVKQDIHNSITNPTRVKNEHTGITKVVYKAMEYLISILNTHCTSHFGVCVYYNMLQATANLNVVFQRM